jgi:hypothetical protein
MATAQTIQSLQSARLNQQFSSYQHTTAMIVAWLKRIDDKGANAVLVHRIFRFTAPAGWVGTA